MTVALVLASYAAVLAVLAPLVLPRSAWVSRAPGLAIAVWVALCASVALSVLLAGLALAMAPGPGPAGAIPARAEALGGAGLALLVLARGGWGVASAAALARRQRRRHAEAVAVLGRPLPELGAVVVDHDAPAAWCLPGRDRRIVVTTGALRALDAEQLRAVVAHERAHLRGRHHLVLTAADAIARAFPLLPLCRHAGLEIASLVEMLADDSAARSHGRAVLAAALVGVADAGVRPSRALAVGGPNALRRMRRMLVPPRPLRLPSRAAVLSGMAAAVVFPPAVACVPLAVLLYLAGRRHARRARPPAAGPSPRSAATPTCGSSPTPPAATGASSRVMAGPPSRWSSRRPTAGSTAAATAAWARSLRRRCGPRCRPAAPSVSPASTSSPPPAAATRGIPACSP
jgi:hypothetical protein